MLKTTKLRIKLDKLLMGKSGRIAIKEQTVINMHRALQLFGFVHKDSNFVISFNVFSIKIGNGAVVMT